MTKPRKERSQRPDILRVPTLALPAELAGAAKAPRDDDGEIPVWLTPPVGYEGGSVAEWTCYWWLKYHKKFREGIDFTAQTSVYAEGVNRDNATRVDFRLPIGLDHPASAPGAFAAVAWDPITPFTHRDRNADLVKRDRLADPQGANTLLVWIDGAALEAHPFDILEDALQGIDRSGRGQGR